MKPDRWTPADLAGESDDSPALPDLPKPVERVGILRPIVTAYLPGDGPKVAKADA